MKLKVDYKKCIKAGECYYNHPELFGEAGSGFPEILQEDIDTDALRKEADEAIEVCPAQAISLEE